MTSSSLARQPALLEKGSGLKTKGQPAAEGGGSRQFPLSGPGGWGGPGLGRRTSAHCFPESS